MKYAFESNSEINLKTKSGKILELQIRFDEVDAYAEAEHFVYDLRTDKDIIGRNAGITDLLTPFANMVKSLSNDIYDNYYVRYTQAQYRYRFLKALGFDTPEPKLQDYAPKDMKFDARLDGKNLLILQILI